MHEQGVNTVPRSGDRAVEPFGRQQNRAAHVSCLGGFAQWRLIVRKIRQGRESVKCSNNDSGHNGGYVSQQPDRLNCSGQNP